MKKSLVRIISGAVLLVVAVINKYDISGLA